MSCIWIFENSLPIMMVCCGFLVMRIWRSLMLSSPEIPIGKVFGNCHNALVSSKWFRGKYRGAKTSKIPQSRWSKQKITISRWFSSRNFRIDSENHRLKFNANSLHELSMFFTYSMRYELPTLLDNVVQEYSMSKSQSFVIRVLLLCSVHFCGWIFNFKKYTYLKYK